MALTEAAYVGAQESAVRPRAPLTWLPLGAVVAAVGYNGALAIADAHGVHQSFATVAVAELAILASLAAFLIILDEVGFGAVCLILGSLALSIYVTLASGALSLDCARDMMIVALFSALGSKISEGQLLWTFRLITLLVLAVLVLELAATDLYVRIFQPAAFYADTRGVKEFSLDQSGLFRNALGFQGRFSFGLTSHRTASIYIEQVSLANFAGVLCVFVITVFRSLSTLDRLLFVGTLLLILLTNDSRTSTTLALISLVGYFICPYVATSWCVLILPACLLAGFAIFSISGAQDTVSPDVLGDNLLGRVTLTFQHLASLDLGALLGFGARLAPSFLDSGYAFATVSFTVIGALLFWLFVATIVPDRSAAHRRCAFGLNLYMCTNLMIGGTAVFSIKVAAPLWLLVGFVCAQPNHKTITRAFNTWPDRRRAIMDRALYERHPH